MVKQHKNKVADKKAAKKTSHDKESWRHEKIESVKTMKTLKKNFKKMVKISSEK